MYYDRLVDDADRAWLFSYLEEAVKNDLASDIHVLLKHLDFNKDGIIDIYMYKYL